MTQALAIILVLARKGAELAYAKYPYRAWWGENLSIGIRCLGRVELREEYHVDIIANSIASAKRLHDKRPLVGIRRRMKCEVCGKLTKVAYREDYYATYTVSRGIAPVCPTTKCTKAYIWRDTALPWVRAKYSELMS